MKLFEFRLEKLLSLRTFYERQSEIELAKAIAYKDYVELELKEIAKLKIKTADKFNPVTYEININELHNVQNYVILLDKKRDELLEKLIYAEKIIEEKRKIYIECAAKRKVVSKLKEKKYEIWKNENMKSEEKYIDDIITYKFGKST